MKKLKNILVEDKNDILKALFISLMLIGAVIIFITSNYADIPFVYNQF